MCVIGTSKLHRSFTENPETENGEEDGESAGLTANCILDVPHLVNICDDMTYISTIMKSSLV